MIKLFLLIPLLLFAPPVFAWDDVPGTTNATGDECSFIKRMSGQAQPVTKWCFEDNAASDGDDETTALNTTICENVDVFFISEIGDDTTFLNTAVAYNLLGTAISASDFIAIPIRGATLDGDSTTASDTSALYGVSAYFLYVRFTTGEATTTSRVAVACHPRR